MKILYLFRKKGQFFSIENIFRQLSAKIGSLPGYTCENAELPEAGFNPASLWRNALFVRKLKTDIFHVTGDVHYITLFLPGKRTVLTIHDCIFIYSNKGIKKWILKKLLLDWPVARCRLITTVSEQTKKDILRLTGCREEKVVVVPNPISPLLSFSARPFDAANPVLLFIGTTPNKNLPRLIEAIHNIPCTLNIIGRMPADLEDSLKKNKINYRNVYDLSNEEMAAQYAQADVVVFPTTFEGFGMPIIEGQRAGRVVVTSDLPPMNGVAAGAACLVDPLDPSSIREGILKVIRDETYRETLIKKGVTNAQKYSVGSIATQYLDHYQKIGS